jgi:hypothetical protein
MDTLTRCLFKPVIINISLLSDKDHATYLKNIALEPRRKYKTRAEIFISALEGPLLI